MHYNFVNEGGLPIRWPLTFWLAGMPRKLPPEEAPLLTWEIYLARSTPAKCIGRAEAADADAANCAACQLTPNSGYIAASR
jgi:hypothetical protein